ncbi:hypothetical protein FRB98_008429 [Tulasnella sp. 332]|nr:hypothetical protein FRB98_008429 [Tulasnella sp. 332]
MLQDMDHHALNDATHTTTVPAVTSPASPAASLAWSIFSTPSYVSSELGSTTSYQPQDINCPSAFSELERGPTKPAIVDLMRAALLLSPDRKATLGQICDLIRKYYKDSKRYKHLNATVRQRLSAKPCFQLAERPDWQKGKSHFWKYVEEADVDRKPGSGRGRRGSHRDSPRSSRRGVKTGARDPSSSPQLEQPTPSNSPVTPTAPAIFQDLSSPIFSDPHPTSTISATLHPSPSGASPFGNSTAWHGVPTTMINTANVPRHANQIGLDGGLEQITYLLRDLRSSFSPMTGLVAPLAMPALEAAAAPPPMVLTQATATASREEDGDDFMHQFVDWGGAIDFRNYAMPP